MNDLANRDRFGDRIHLGIALATLFTMPFNSSVGGVLFGALVVWCVVRTCFWRNDLPAGPRLLMLAGAAWIAVLAISFLWSPDQRFGQRILWAQRWILLVIALWPLLNRWKYLCIAFIAGSELQSLAQLVQGLLGTYEGTAPRGFAEHPRTAAAWQAASIVTIITLFLAAEFRRWWWLLLIIPIAIALVIANSRGGALAVVPSILVAVIMLLVGRTIKPFRLLIIALLMTISFTSMFFMQSHLVDRLGSAVRATTSAINEGTYSDYRLAWWRSSLRQWKNHPVLGYGVGGTRSAFEDDAVLQRDASRVPGFSSEGDGQPYRNAQGLEIHEFNQPHSVYFQVLVENGVIGVLAGGVLLGVIVVTGIRNARKNPIGSLGLSMLVVWLTTAAFDSWYAQGQPLALFWLSATLCFAPRTALNAEIGES